MSEEQLNFDLPSLEEVAELFPAYQDFHFIAQGGMSAVFKATQSSLEREVALKILPKELSADESYRALFHKEAKAMAKLAHPSLIAIYDFGQVGDYLFISMEYINGKAIHYSIYGDVIDAQTAARLTIEILSGLEVAHKNNIIHRDISPGNIFLDQDHKPKIGDFGLSKSNSLEDEDSAHGTPGYTAPEVIDHPEMIDHRADIYSTGVMFFQMLSGTVPPDFETNMQGERPSVPCPSAFQEIIIKATEADPKSRYASATEMISAIQSALNHQEVAVNGVKTASLAAASKPRLKAGFESNTGGKFVTGAGAGGKYPTRISSTPKKYKKKVSLAGPLIFIFFILLCAGAGYYYLYVDDNAPKVSVPDIMETIDSLKPTE